ncbi:orotidine-5'-phosphate decarboxylase [Ligilactobacillus sp. WC1T17]|uniref:Orotidine 5'-phosphate decarboxylase n=1 Tax=Ligilactobacillus ruminis TaxID=1623 RepID=A0ABY1AA60_9LACO|nr:orotidine-5'-phosphate decarboxylase [Ligilactobacillus ruminis]
MKIDRPIIALDFPDKEICLNFLKQFPKDESLFVKIGMELFYAEGPDMVKELKAMGHDIFLDLKCHDIPHTVEATMRILGKLGVALTTTHAPGGSEMLKAAKNGLIEGALQAGQKTPRLLAITQLTSTDERMVKEEQLLSCNLNESVKSYAKLAYASNLDGVVCSAYEAQMIAEATSPDFLRVTPGIRLLGGDAGDQKRVMTPDKAAQNGSSALVVGRSITQAPDAILAYRQVCDLWRN